MKNKICHITTVHYAKDTRIFQKECVSLAKHGFETHLIVANQKSEIDQGVQIHNIISTTSGRLQRMRKTTQIAFEKAMEIDADIYHFHDPELLPVGLKLKKQGKKVIYDTHEDVPRQILSKYYLPAIVRPIIAKVFEIYENRIAAKMDAVITATPFIRDRFLTINPITVDINNYPIFEKFNIEIPKEKIHDICYVGLMSKIRGIEEMVSMLEFTDAKMTLIGEFQSKEEEAFIKKLPTWEKVNFLGKKSQKEVAEILSQSKMGIVVFRPEPNHINAQPNKIFEYMAASLPIVTSNFPLWKSIVKKHHAGVCANPLEPKEIAKAVNTLLENKNQSIQMGKNGQQAVQDVFNWKQEEVKLIKLYEQLSSGSL
jgi:glycosyltransferase involved in cell wall biosynthesis